MTTQLEIHLAMTSDLNAAETWLSQAGLPTEEFSALCPGDAVLMSKTL
jgi:hypothetical protein